MYVSLSNIINLRPEETRKALIKDMEKPVKGLVDVHTELSTAYTVTRDKDAQRHLLDLAKLRIEAYEKACTHVKVHAKKPKAKAKGKAKAKPAAAP